MADELIEAGLTASERQVLRLCSRIDTTSAFVCQRPGKNRLVGPPVHEDLVHREFVADGRDQFWLTDIIEHPTGERKC